LFEKTKALIWCKFGVANQQKRQDDLLMESSHDPPHKVINHKAIFVLPTAVVSMEVDFCFPKGMVLKKVVEH